MIESVLVVRDKRRAQAAAQAAAEEAEAKHKQSTSTNTNTSTSTSISCCCSCCHETSFPCKTSYHAHCYCKEAFMKRWDDQTPSLSCIARVANDSRAKTLENSPRGELFPSRISFFNHKQFSSPSPSPSLQKLFLFQGQQRRYSTVVNLLYSFSYPLTPYPPSYPPSYPTLPPFPSRDFILSPLVRYPVFPHQYQTTPSPLRALRDPSNGMFMWQNLQLSPVLSLAHLLQFGSSL
jgi:hypothetical protein